MEFEIRVIAKIEGKKSNIEIGFPSNKPHLDVRESSHLLASGISLLIKSCSKYSLEIKDSDLLKEVIKHLEDEFVSTTSFEDVGVSNKMVVK